MNFKNSWKICEKRERKDDDFIVIKIVERVFKNYYYIMKILKTCFSGVTRYNYFIKYLAG